MPIFIDRIAVSKTRHVTSFISLLLLLVMVAIVMTVASMSTVGPSTCQNAPVSSSEGGITESVEDRVDGAVDVAQPVSCRQQTILSCSR